ncbi:MAG: hypothetical protein CVU39_17825 [Chloroflexi bacterium HGW-Chloroflexi-10]|nr:MAG: hypothetical protein CVU39_17825 [Chloroflexi bacterium HGW-Chloroflexi-10]
MKIAIYHNLPSGGARRSVYELTRRLAQNHSITIFSYQSANHTFGDLRPLGIEHRLFEFKPSQLFHSPFGRLNQLQRWKDLLRLQSIEQNISNIIEAENFDLVWVHPCQIQNTPSILKYLRKVPTVYFAQEPIRILYETMPERPYDRKELLHRRLVNKVDPFRKLFFSRLRQNDRENIQHPTRVLVNSQHMQSAFMEIYHIRSYVNYPGVDLILFQPDNNEKEDFVFSVGSLTPLKGFDFLIRAIGKIPVNHRPPLRIASNFENPQERDFLMKLAKEHQITLFLETGITDQRLVELYNRAKITVYSPYREPLGVVPIESMACGTPVVGIKEGGLLETILDGKTGCLIERDEQAFANAIQDLLNDPQKREQYGKASREEAQTKWSWESSTKMLENHFQAVLMS